MPLMPSALSEVKGKAGSNSSPGFLVLFKINNGKIFFNRQYSHFSLWNNLHLNRCLSKSESAKCSHSSVTSYSGAMLILRGIMHPYQASSFNSVQMVMNLKILFIILRVGDWSTSLVSGYQFSLCSSCFNFCILVHLGRKKFQKSFEDAFH